MSERIRQYFNIRTVMPTHLRRDAEYHVLSIPEYRIFDECITVSVYLSRPHHLRPSNNQVLEIRLFQSIDF